MKIEQKSIFEVGKDVYFANGEAVRLKEIIGTRAVINKLYETYYENGETYCEVGNEDIIVDVVTLYITPPAKKYHDDLLEIRNKIKLKETQKVEIESEIRLKQIELSKLKNEITQTQTTQINQNKFILNLTELKNAKKIVFFSERQVMPKIVEPDDKYYSGIKISSETSLVYSGHNTRYWGYRLYNDSNGYGGYSSGDFLCPKYGLLLDPTQEDIDNTIIKRLNEIEFDKHAISTVPDELLQKCEKSEKLLLLKATYLNDKKIEDNNKLITKKEQLQKELDSVLEKLEKLENENN